MEVMMVIDANGWIIRLTFLFGGVVDWALGLCNYCGLAVNFWCGGGLDASIEAIAPWRISYLFLFFFSGVILGGSIPCAWLIS